MFSCLEKYQDIFQSENEEDRNHIYINVFTGSKVLAMAGMLSCMLWKGTRIMPSSTMKTEGLTRAQTNAR
ncbi:hypothetical protein [Candidatus Nitrososphaera evergladensis]|uniref:hypothetical protein n=1 Tax=Candidatus Nitrososphaera evergladensis TaxID=1459637 RepID=UPI001D050202